MTQPISLKFYFMIMITNFYTQKYTLIVLKHLEISEIYRLIPKISI